jgi:hypothetical protein
MKRLKRENQLKADAARPLAEFRKEFGEGTNIDEVVAMSNPRIGENDGEGAYDSDD